MNGISGLKQINCLRCFLKRYQNYKNSGIRFMQKKAGERLLMFVLTGHRKIGGLCKRAGSIIRAAGMSCPITPESIAYIYEENKKRNLEWRSISEKEPPA